MKLATITEAIVAADESAQPRTWREADRLFDEGMTAAESGDRHRAYTIFKQLADYDGDGPPELRDSARQLRDFYDPHSSPEARARLIRQTLPAQFISIDTKTGRVAQWQESRDRERSVPEQASLRLDPPTLAWVVTSDLIASAFRALERGDLDEADDIFADFLDRTKNEPSAALRATAMLARQAVADRRSVCEVPPDEIIMPFLKSVIDSSQTD